MWLLGQKYYFLTYIPIETETFRETYNAGFLVRLCLFFVHVVRVGYMCMTYHTLCDSHYLKFTIFIMLFPYSQKR
jgi:hypothetical protein